MEKSYVDIRRFHSSEYQIYIYEGGYYKCGRLQSSSSWIPRNSGSSQIYSFCLPINCNRMLVVGRKVSRCYLIGDIALKLDASIYGKFFIIPFWIIVMVTNVSICTELKEALSSCIESVMDVRYLLNCWNSLKKWILMILLELSFFGIETFDTPCTSSILPNK